jgi:hypothetical protein
MKQNSKDPICIFIPLEFTPKMEEPNECITQSMDFNKVKEMQKDGKDESN